MAFFFLTHASICGTTDKTMVSNGMPQSAVVVSVKHGKPTWFPSETLKARAMRRSVAKGDKPWLRLGFRRVLDEFHLRLL